MLAKLHAALILLACVGAADQARAEKISLMVGGYEKQIYLPAKLAESLGYFREQGLDVELLNEPDGVEAEDALLAGAVQGVIGFYDHTVDLQSKGKFVESVVQFSQAPGEVEMVSNLRPDINSVADLKGQVTGVTGLGSSTSFLEKYLVVKSGLKISDVTAIPVGAGLTFIAAMQQDKIQAGMTTEPTVSVLTKMRLARPLVDLRTVEATKALFGGPYPAASLYMENAYVDAHKDTVQKLANAFVKTLRYIADHSAGDIADAMPQEFYVGDKALYIQGLAAGKRAFTADGRMPDQGPETVLAVLSTFSKGVRSKFIDLSKTYTRDFVDAAH